MALFDTLFGKKKKEFKASCQITKEPIEKGFGYLLTTAQVVTSKRYWDMIMTEPETMSYTISHFNNQPSGTQMRNMIFEKYAGIAKPWIISDSIISYFEIDKASAKDNAKKWWESDGSFIPTQTGPASENLDSTLFQSVKDYAILEAGRSKVKLAS
ncbi:MAG: hypothetical protein ACK5RG_00390 [Cyclobacteriaceae bacterium]|jgi:hypothetical protein|nr:hypothetical protein [Flammeovirgaceae bacterium]